MLRILVIAVLYSSLVPGISFAGQGWSPPPPPGKPIHLRDSVINVLRTHHMMKAMLEDRSTLTHELDRARSGFGPRVDVEGKAGFGILSDSSTRRLGTDKQFGEAAGIRADLVQPIWDGFATRSKVRQAQSTLDSVKARVFDTATALSLDGAIAHINLHRQRILLQAAEENVRRHKAILAQAQDRASMGADTYADVTQAQSRVERAMSDRAEVRNQLRLAEYTYYRITGFPGTSIIERAPFSSKEPPSPAIFLALAEKNNPKLEAFLHDIRSARAQRELADSAMRPSVQLEAGPNYDYRGGPGDRWTYSFDVLATVRWNLYNGGGDEDAQKAASARIRQARHNFYNYFEDLKLDIESTWSNYKAAQELYKHYSQAAQYNTKTSQAYHEQFLMGTRSLLDVLDAENELYHAKIQAITARGNMIIGIYRLDALSGTLLSKLKIDTSPLNQSPEGISAIQGEERDLGWFD